MATYFASEHLIVSLKRQAFINLVDASQTAYKNQNFPLARTLACVAVPLLGNETPDYQLMDSGDLLGALLATYGENETHIKLADHLRLIRNKRYRDILQPETVDAYLAMGKFEEALVNIEKLERVDLERNIHLIDYDGFRYRALLGLGKEQSARIYLERMKNSNPPYLKADLDSLSELLHLTKLSDQEALDLAIRQIKYESKDMYWAVPNLQYIARLMENYNHPKAAKLILDKIEELRGK